MRKSKQSMANQAKKTQYNLVSQTNNISSLSSGNVSKYEFLPGKELLTVQGLLEKAAALKRLEYSWLDQELEVLTDIAKKQNLHKGLGIAFISLNK